MTCATGVACPHCGEKYKADLCDGDEALVTYWGEFNVVTVTCRECDRDFELCEHVVRSWSLVPRRT